MTEDNSRQPGEPSISSSPQSHGMYPPPQSYSSTRSAFVDIRIGDYTRDGTVAALLFVSLFLPWSATVGIARVGSSALVLLLVLPTLLSLASLLLPYVARLGMLGPNWNVGQIRVLRLVANGPLIATVVGLVSTTSFVECSDSVRVRVFSPATGSALERGSGLPRPARSSTARGRNSHRPSNRAAMVGVGEAACVCGLGVVSGLGATRADLHPGLRQSLPILRRAADIREPDRSLRVVGRSDRRGGCCGSRSRQTVCVLAPHHRRARHRSPRGRIAPLDQRGHKCRAVPHGHG